MAIGAGQVGEHVDGFGNIISDLGEALGCPLLPGATTHIGFDECKEPFTNYFLVTGTTDDVPFQAALVYNLGLGGGLVKVDRGTIVFDVAVIIYGNLIIDGAGQQSTVITISAGADCNVFEYTGADNYLWCHIYHLIIDANKDNNALGNGIYINAAGQFQDGMLWNVYCRNCSEAGFYCNKAWGWRLIDYLAEFNEGNGADLAGGSRPQIMFCKIRDNEGDGLKIAGGAPIIIGNDISTNLGRGVRISAGSGEGVVVGNTFVENAGTQFLLGSNNDDWNFKGNVFDGGGVSVRGIDIGLATCERNDLRGNKFFDHTTEAVRDLGTDTILDAIRGEFTQSGGGSAGRVAPVINTSPGGIDIDGNDEFADVRIPLGSDIQQVIRIKIWAYSNVIEATNNMLLRIVAHGAGSGELWNGNAVDVPDHPSEEEGGIIQYDVIHWVVESGDDAQIGTLAANELLELLAVGEVASAPDIATDALLGGYEIQYV